jgi:hypothetical protein
MYADAVDRRVTTHVFAAVREAVQAGGVRPNVVAGIRLLADVKSVVDHADAEDPVVRQDVPRRDGPPR